MKKHIVLFLTACINPQGMAFTVVQNCNERLGQYIKALQWYLDNTQYPILFVENTKFDIVPFFQRYIENGRLEVLSFDGNNYDKSIGKGYGEAMILEYGIKNSKILALYPDVMIVKITGRLICNNINVLLKYHSKSNTVYANYAFDENRCINRDSRLFMAPKCFFNLSFLPHKSKINDSKHYYFEHHLYDCIEEWINNHNCAKEFFILPALRGYSGSQGTLISTNGIEMLKHFIKVLLHLVKIYRF